MSKKIGIIIGSIIGISLGGVAIYVTLRKKKTKNDRPYEPNGNYGELDPEDLDNGYVWSDWTPCSKDCGGGTQTRMCLRGDCTDKYHLMKRNCNTHTCGNVPGWHLLKEKYTVANMIPNTDWKTMPLSECCKTCEENPHCNAIVYSLPAKWAKDDLSNRLTKGGCRHHSGFDASKVTNHPDKGNGTYWIGVPETVAENSSIP